MQANQLMSAPRFYKCFIHTKWKWWTLTTSNKWKEPKNMVMLLSGFVMWFLLSALVEHMVTISIILMKMKRTHTLSYRQERKKTACQIRINYGKSKKREKNSIRCSNSKTSLCLYKRELFCLYHLYLFATFLSDICFECTVWSAEWEMRLLPHEKDCKGKKIVGQFISSDGRR